MIEMEKTHQRLGEHTIKAKKQEFILDVWAE